MLRKTVTGIMLFLLLVSTLTLAFNIQPVKASGTVGVKAGDWMKYTYTISGWPSGTPYPEWLKIEFLSVEGTNATVRVTMHMSDGTEQSDTMTVDVAAGGGTFQGLSGFVIPANCTTGDSVYMSGYGNVTIVGETTGTYAGASRTVVYTSFSQYGTQLTYYWDKQTGVMVEASVVSGGVTARCEATETNMWRAEIIYIRVDGSIDPSDAPISTVDNVTYTLTGNVTSDADGIVVERDSIVIDGAGYTVQGAGNGIGIDLSDRNNVTIKNVQTKAFFYGIYLYFSSNNRLFGNQMTANSYGVMLVDSSNNTISGNSIMNNDWGIQLYWSSNNTLRNNNATNNEYAFAVYGGFLLNYIQDVDVSNTVDGKPVYYWINRQNLAVPFDAGYVALVNCTGITLRNLNLTKNGQGALLAYTTDSTITENSITDNWEGIYLYESSNNTISGNSITANNYGIILDNFSDNNTISKNNVTDSYNGIYLLNHSGHNIISENNVTACLGYGISIWLSEYNSIYANNATNNRDGIYFYESPNNFLTYNNAKGNTEYGIFLWNSGDNTLTNNNLTGNWLDFGVNAEYLSGFYQSIDSSNLINGKPIYYLMDLENTIITPNDYPNIGYMALVNGNSVAIENTGLQGVQGLELVYSKNCSLKNVNIENCTIGIWLLNSDNNTVSNATVSNSYAGILYLNSINNSLFENVLSGNEYGIWSFNSHGNAIRHNSFLNNSQQVHSQQSANIWDGGYPSGGNYWSDYTGTDLYTGPFQNETGSDGIGDTPYVIDGDNTDRYPLMKPYVARERLLGDVNGDQKVNLKDVMMAVQAFNSFRGYQRWNADADLDSSGRVDMRDILVIVLNFNKHE